MKREIKFRGKCLPDTKYAGEWVRGGYIPLSKDITPNNEGLIMRFLGGDNTITYHVDPYTVGQFTGLYDKNGVEIYEGDIVKTQFNRGALGRVTWHNNGYFCICAFEERFKCGEDFTPIGIFMQHNISGKKIEIEVIGNIYDNRDLL